MLSLCHDHPWCTALTPWSVPQALAFVPLRFLFPQYTIICDLAYKLPIFREPSCLLPGSPSRSCITLCGSAALPGEQVLSGYCLPPVCCLNMHDCHTFINRRAAVTLTAGWLRDRARDRSRQGAGAAAALCPLWRDPCTLLLHGAPVACCHESASQRRAEYSQQW